VQPLRIALAQLAPRLGLLDASIVRHHDLLAEAREGYISLQAARRDYGMAIDVERRTRDDEETARLRSVPPPPKPGSTERTA
jgi:hypothetical protein